MDFTPQTESALRPLLFPKGEYPFAVIAANERRSARGNAMLVLQLMVSDGKDARITVTDYLVAKRPLKLRNAALACGLGAEYESGRLTGSDFAERTGQLKLAVKKDPDGLYPDCNVVIDYLAPAASSGRGISIDGASAPRKMTLEDALARFAPKNDAQRSGK